MVIEIFADGLDRAHINWEKHRRACRGVLLNEGKILGEFYPNRDVYNLPGGGLEPGESLEDCCVREVLEETGVRVKVSFPTCTVMEYFPEGTFETHFFRCEVLGEPQIAPTPTESETVDGLKSGWYDLFDFLEKLETYESKDPMGANIHQRELIGLLNSI